MLKILLLLLATGSLGTTGPRVNDADEAPAGSGGFFAPLSLEGYLWAPVLNPYLRNAIDIKLGWTSHEYYLYSIYSRAHLANKNVTISGEYSFFNKLTVGVDVPLNFIGVDSSDFPDHSETALSNIRLHVRYPVLHFPELGIILTPAIRVWLPTNTNVPVYEARLESMVMYETMVLFGYGTKTISIIAEAGLKILAFDDRYDYSFGSANIVVGLRPFSGHLDYRGFELIGELNFLAELDDNHAFSKYFTNEDEYSNPNDPARALAVGVGLRNKWETFNLEIALRIGLNDYNLSLGGMGLGVKLGFDFSE